MRRSLFVASFFILISSGAAFAYAQSVSPDGSSITPLSGDSLVTTDGTWTFSSQVIDGNNVILLNGQTTNGWGVKLVVSGRKVYQLNAAGTWYVYQNGGWSQTTAPQTSGGGGASCSDNLVNYYSSSVTVPTGYGSAYDLFSSQHELLVSVQNCPALTMTVGSGAQNQYIYKQGYVYQSTTWQPLNLIGTGLISNAWYPGIASAGLGSSIPDAWTYVVGYVCQWGGTSWQCGCHDTGCAVSAWQLQAFESQAASNGGGSATGVPAPAAAVGYTYQATNLGSFTDLSMMDIGQHQSSKAFYTESFCCGVAPLSMFSLSGGDLVVNDHLGRGQTTFGSMGPDGSGAAASLNPPAGWVGTVYGPGFYMEATVKFPSSNMQYTSNWPALWGNTFYNYANEIGIQGVEVDWAEFFKDGDTNYGSGSHDWIPPSTRNDYGCDCNPMPSGGVNTFHTYGLLVVPSQDNNGTGYMKFYLDGQELHNTNITWTSGGPNSRLDTTPFAYQITPGADGDFVIRSLRVFVKDASKVIRN